MGHNITTSQRQTMTLNIPCHPGHQGYGPFLPDRISMMYQILGGIPGRAIDLQAFYEYCPRLECSTIACGAGWLALHPQMRKLGFPPPETLDGRAAYCWIMREISEVLGPECDEADANTLFCVRPHGPWDHYLLTHLERQTGSTTDKQLLMARLKYAFDHFCGESK